MTFSGEPKTRWIAESNGERRMTLLDEFWFTDRAGRRWTAPEGAIIDGASIPRALWTTVGSPYTGQYRRASIVHDVACENAANPEERRAADKMFFEACRAGGCSRAEAMILYMGVRVGSAWSRQALDAVTYEASDRPRLHRTAVDVKTEGDFRLATELLLAGGETDDPEELERRADEAIAAVVARDRAFHDLIQPAPIDRPLPRPR